MIRPKWAAAWKAALTVLLCGTAVAQVAEQPEATVLRKTITKPGEIWATPSDEKALVHALRLEGRVTFYDAAFRLCWLEQDQVGTYVQLAEHPPELKIGQRVRLEGTIVPAKGLAADTVKVTVLSEYEPIEPLATAGRINETGILHDRIVTAEAYVDGQKFLDPQHILLSLVIENRSVAGWVRPDDPGAVPNWPGHFIRIQGLYSTRFDATQTRIGIELWTSRQSDVQIIGTIADTPLFRRPETPIDELYRLPAGTPVRIRGRVENQELGSELIVRDATGQVVVRSAQKQSVAPGAEIEVAGQLVVSGAGWLIDAALFREVPEAELRLSRPEAGQASLRTVAQIRQLDDNEVSRAMAVNVSGTVTWSQPENDFFFLQDVSGGIRVHYSRSLMETPLRGKYLQVEGVTRRGRFAPAIEMKRFKDLGSMDPPDPKPVTFDQAITGREDGQWVEMRGFIQRTASEGNRHLIYVTTPTGEFVAEIPYFIKFVANPGSLVRVHGVCDTETDTRGTISGVTIHTPFLQDIIVDQDAPFDFYNLPRRSIRHLDQMSARVEMTRVRINGIVLHAATDGSVFVQEGDSSLLVLSRETVPLVPGDHIEAVGVLGRAGARTVLREAVYRRTGPGPAPVPATLVEPDLLSVAKDSHLMRARGVLIDEFDQPGLTRLTLQSGSTIFEATLVRRAGSMPPGYALGSGLEVTGIYRLEFDDSRQMRGFQLQLRSPDDITVYQQPRLWTLQRALLAAVVFGGCTLLGLGWITALRRQVRRQTGQIRTQLERQARLEAEVQRAARLESLGELAGGIAHDFNNVLTGIMGHTSLAMFDRQAMTLVGKSLREIERGAHRARDLTQQLLTFAKGGDPVRTILALPALVWEASELELHGVNVTCNLSTPPGLWSVHADKSQISLVLQNLLRNARQAMPNGGVVRVALDNEEISGEEQDGRASGRYVRLTLVDTGEGISAENLPRIFDPYFSTRRSGGLGLATVYSIVKKHRGFLDVQSTPGAGTTFRVWLPAAEPGEVPVPAVLAKTPVVPGSRRVLLMDDEESIRELGALALQRMGLEVTMVAEGASAIEEFARAQAAGRPYRLVILDLNVAGGLGGVETIQQVRKLDPEVLAIVSSGYSDDPVMAKFRDYGFQAIVPKPYTVGQFTQVVELLLG